MLLESEYPILQKDLRSVNPYISYREKRLLNYVHKLALSFNNYERLTILSIYCLQLSTYIKVLTSQNGK